MPALQPRVRSIVTGNAAQRSDTRRNRPHLAAQARRNFLSLVDKICFFPTAKGGIAAGWAFYDIKWKKIAPKAFIFGVTNPVMVQRAVFAGIPITEG